MLELSGNIELLGKRPKKKKPVYRKANGFNSGQNRKGSGLNSGKKKIRNAGTYYSTDKNLLEQAYDFHKGVFVDNPINLVKNTGKQFINLNKKVLYQNPKRLVKDIYDAQKDVSQQVYETGENIYQTGKEVIDESINTANNMLETVEDTAGSIWDTVTGFFDKYKWWVIGGLGAIILVYFITSTKAGTAVYRSYFPASRRRK